MHPGRIYGLDVIRAFAILAVVYSHSLVFLPESIRGIAGLFDYDGVSVFFVLSGFLIGGILITSDGSVPYPPTTWSCPFCCYIRR